MSSSARIKQVLEMPERVMSSSLGWPGDGHVNPDLDALTAAVGELRDIPDDAERDAVVNPWVDVAIYVGKAIGILVSAADEETKLISSTAMKMWMVQSDQNATKSVPTSGHASGADYESRVASARDAGRRAMQVMVADQVADGFGDKPKSLGAKAAEKANAADAALHAAIARAEMPISLRPGITLLDLAVQERLRQEVLSWGPNDSMRKAIVQLTRAIEADDEKILQNMIAGFTSAANEIIKTNPAKLAAQATHYSGRFDSSGDDPQTSAAKLLALIAEYRENQRPPSIASVIEVRKKILVVYANTFNSTQSLSTSYQFVDGDPLAMGPSWDVDDSWYRKYLGPGLKLPGYSEVVIPGRLDELANGQKMWSSLPVRAPAKRSR